MRKNLIALSAAAFIGGLGMVGSASAIVVADTRVNYATDATSEVVAAGGIGHQLIVPYFNTQFGNATLFNLVNTDTVNGKAVKIRFRSASNSDDIFDFQIYMSPGDVWAATLTRSASGVTQLSTNDKSCTLPNGVGSGGGSTFVTARLPGNLTGDALATQTREGYIEIFNMADVPPTLTAGGVNPLFTAIKHVAGVAPCTPATMNTLANDPADLAAAQALGLNSPSTGLFANFTIINVPKSGAASGEATAIIASIAGAAPGTTVNGRGNIVFFPQVGGAATTPDNFTADPVLRTVAGAGPTDVQNGAGLAFTGTTPVVAASFFDLPDLSTPYLLALAAPAPANPITQAESLTRALATMNVVNEYITDPNITAKTDWVFSMPTRRYSVAVDYRPLASAGTPLRAFTKFVNRDYFTAANTSLLGSQVCVATNGITYYDREETTLVGSSFVISPNPPAAIFRLCGEASILTFNTVAGESVLGAEVARTDIKTGTFTDGWANVATPGLLTGAAPGVGTAAGVTPAVPAGNGLPILGKSYARATNPAIAAGISGNFGASWEHRYVRPVQP